MKVGHFVRFDPEEIAVWLDAQRVAVSGMPSARLKHRDNAKVASMGDRDATRARRVLEASAGLFATNFPAAAIVFRSSLLVPRQATFARNEIARSASLSLWRLRQAM